MKDIAVLVSGNGTNLQAIIDACASKKIKNGSIKIVISSSSSAFALKRAELSNIETLVVSRKEFVSLEQFNYRLFKELQDVKPDLIVLAGFMQILSKTIVNNFRNKIINVHPSLLPAFGGLGCYGLNVHKKALERGVKVTGATVHFVNEIADGGPIIAQKVVTVDDYETPETLQKKVQQQAEWELLPLAIDLFCSEKIKVVNDKVFIERF